MDWFAWLSKTNLDAALIYDYGLTLARNELQEDDLPYFNHDFLQSIGISVAKHRLEILKLCTKEVRGRTNNGLSRLVIVVKKTRKLFARNISKLGFHKTQTQFSPCSNQWSGALRKIENRQDRKSVIAGAGGNVMWSGPLDRRLQGKLMAASRWQSVSGPLDVKMNERLMHRSLSPMVARPGLVCGSPIISGPIDRFGLSPKVGYYGTEVVGDDHSGAQSLWSIMFQDMKPT